MIDREAGHLFDGPHFNFQPYDYGPFDRDVYQYLDILAAAGLSLTTLQGRYRQYQLSPEGYKAGRLILEKLEDSRSEYLTQITNWLRALSFRQLVSAIYQRHPDMKVNSVFNG